jgi:hypothetical protein
MSKVRTMRRLALAGGTAALVAMGALTAGCSSPKEEPAPTSTTPSSTTSTVVSETQKALTPGGGNSFSPTIDPTQPGGTCKSIVNGVCIR